MEGRRISVRRTVVLGLAAVMTALFTSASPVASDSSSTTVTLRGVQGQTVAQVRLVQYSATQTLVVVAAQGLTAGFHGFHVHAVGICDPNAKDATGATVPFASAGGHFNPAGATHGAHAGDMPVLLVQQNGQAVGSVLTDRFTIAQLRDADGSAIIIHAGPDNLANIPARYVQAATGTPGPDAATLATGDSGGRFACGVVS